MRREEALKRLRELAEHPGRVDPEIAHADADRVLLELLNDSEVWAAWEKVPRWYA